MKIVESLLSLFSYKTSYRFCKCCECYRLHIKGKYGWYCGTCGEYK